MTSASPHILHLLGRWQDARLVFDAIPNRLDFFKNTKKESPSIVVNRLEICKTADHRHFPSADTAKFPSNPVVDQQSPEPENYNWQPWLRENRLWNWNLEEEIAGDEPQHLRRRRQAPEQPESRPQLLGHNNLISLLCRENSLKASIQKPYSFFAAAFVNQTWGKKILPGVRDHFQYVWDDDQTWNVEMQKLGDTNFYKVHFVVPPFCKVFFSDVSVMQALGFDSVGLGYQQDKFSIRSHKQKSGATSYFWHNNNNTARTYISVRAIENLPIYKLRGEAKKARQLLSEELKSKAPEILHEREELDTKFDVTYEYTPGKMDPIQSEFAGRDQLNAPTNPADKVILFENFFQFLLNHLCTKLGLNRRIFKIDANEPDAESVILTYTPPTQNRLDRMTVLIELGEETGKIFKYLQQPNKIEWNLGRQNPYIFQVVELSGQKKKDFDLAEKLRLAERKRKLAAKVAADKLEGKPAVVQDPKPKIAAAQDIITGHKAEVQDPKIRDVISGRPAETHQPGTPPPIKKIKINEPQTPTAQDVIKLNVRANVGDGAPIPEQKAPQGAVGIAEAGRNDPQGAVGGVDVGRNDPQGAVGGNDPQGAVGGIDPPGVAGGNDPPGVAGGNDPQGAAGGNDPQGAVAPADADLNVPPAGIGGGAAQAPDVINLGAGGGGGGGGGGGADANVAGNVDQGGDDAEEEEEGDDNSDDDEPNVNPVILNIDPPIPPEPFTRSRPRFLVGNSSRKRRWPGQPDENTLPTGVLLVLENALQENDFITDYGRCCVAATILDGKVVTKNKCYINLDCSDQISFQVFDSQHLSLVKVPSDQLVKIEILLNA